MCSTILVGSIFAPGAMASNDNKSSKDEVSVMGSDDPYQNMRWRWPTTSTVISDDYGNVGWRWHKGIDIGVRKKSVYAVASGTVIQSGHFNDGVTYAITIKHSDKDPDTGKNLITRYLHLEPEELYYTTNEKVTKGETIATSGTSGATGYHLHFDVNAKGLTYPGDRDTFSPWVFWPENQPSSLASLKSSEEYEQHDEESHDEEHFFDFLLIAHVGTDEFYDWFDSIDESERTITNFKKHFNLSDKEIKEIMKTTLSNKKKVEILESASR